MKIVEMTVLDPAETLRVYRFPDGHTVELANVTHIHVSDSGTHRLVTTDGTLHIVHHGWLHIEITALDWTL